MKTLKLLCFAVLLFATFIIHECGHAIELVRAGATNVVVSAGWDFGFLPQYDYPVQGFTLRVSPLPIGAYTTSDAAGIAAAQRDFATEARIDAGGIAFNFIASALVLLFICPWRRKELWGLSASVGLPALVALALPNTFALFVMPAIGCYGLGWFVLLFARNFRTQKSPAKQLFGRRWGLRELPLFFSIASAGLGLTNALPLFPLDGGHLVSRLLADYAGPDAAYWFQHVSPYFWVILIASSFALDAFGKAK